MKTWGKQVKNARQLKQHGAYVLLHDCFIWHVHFIEVTKPKVPASIDVLTTNEVPNAQFVSFKAEPIAAKDRFKLFDFCKKNKIGIFEEESDQS